VCEGSLSGTLIYDRLFSFLKAAQPSDRARINKTGLFPDLGILSSSDVQAKPLFAYPNDLSTSGMRKPENTGRKLDNTYKFVTGQSLRRSALFPRPLMPADLHCAVQPVMTNGGACENRHIQTL
jgi:hypothetical protein